MSTCYFASGESTAGQGSTYIPCNTTAVAEGKHSACCAPNDMCLTNGLCKANNVNQFNWNWRIACTDKSFKDPSCPNYCRGIGSDSDAHMVFQCQDNKTWCCATGNPDSFARNYNFTCCDIPSLTMNLGKAVFYTNAAISLDISSVERTTTSSTSTSASTSTQPTTTASVTASPSLSPSPSTIQIPASATATGETIATDPSIGATAGASTTSKSLTIGLGVGIPVGVLLIAAVCFLFWRMGQRHSQRAQAQAKEQSLRNNDNFPESAHQQHPPPEFQAHHYYTNNPARQTLASGLEIDSRALKAEMAYARDPVELEDPHYGRQQKEPTQ